MNNIFPAEREKEMLSFVRRWEITAAVVLCCYDYAAMARRDEELVLVAFH